MIVDGSPSAENPERNILLTLSYDGSFYNGWQIQKEHPSVQRELENALRSLFGTDVRVAGVGRTDSGAHALSYCASFKTINQSLPAGRFPMALNSALPRDIRVISARTVPLDFHARFSAQAREYLYFLWNGPVMQPVFNRYVHQVDMDLDWETMKEAVSLFPGKRDFTHFSYGYDSPVDSTRRLFYLRLRRTVGLNPIGRETAVNNSGYGMVFTIKCEGFLRGMIRTIVSVILNTGFGKVGLDSLREALEGGKGIPPRLRVPVPACGLYFKRAYYNSGSLTITGQ